MAVTDGVKDEVRVPDTQAVIDPEVLENPVAVEDKHEVGEVLTEEVVDEDPVMVPEVQGEGVFVEEEQ